MIMRFSIIIPTCDRPQRLRRCLAAVANLEYPREEFEVIVADDGSEKPLAGVINEFAPRMNLTLLLQGTVGPASARNLGAAHARGEILAFLDDDCGPQSDWLLELGAAAERSPRALLGGDTVNGCPDNPFAAANQRYDGKPHLPYHRRHVENSLASV